VKEGKNGAARGDLVWRDFVTLDGVFSVDQSQRIVGWGPSAERLLGHRSEDVVGKHCYDVIAGRDAFNHLYCRSRCPVFTNASRGQPTGDFDVQCALPNGERRWLNVSIVVPKGKEQEFQILHLFRDVTRRRQVEEFAQRVSSALREFMTDGNGQPTADAAPSVPPPRLSRRESQVLGLLAAGMSTGQIADALSVQPVTARNHISRVISRLGVANRLQAVVYASEHHLI
jgi:PAS domain S-box-containing protein